MSFLPKFYPKYFYKNQIKGIRDISLTSGFCGGTNAVLANTFMYSRTLCLPLIRNTYQQAKRVKPHSLYFYIIASTGSGYSLIKNISKKVL